MESGTSFLLSTKLVTYAESCSIPQKCTACTKPRNKAHGAPIQCTKGKCPKAFHVSCARDGMDNGIIYEVLREVEKEVVLTDPQEATADTLPEAAPSSAVVEPFDNFYAMPVPMIVDELQPFELSISPATGPAGTPGPRVLKVVRKSEVQVLCPQHNPVCMS